MFFLYCVEESSKRAASTSRLSYRKHVGGYTCASMRVDTHILCLKDVSQHIPQRRIVLSISSTIQFIE